MRAGELSGQLPSVLRRLATRHERSSELHTRLIGILTYPCIVMCVGIGVVIFLSSRTLPDLVLLLTDAGVDTPGLTLLVIGAGQWLLHAGPLTLVGLVASVLLLRFAASRHEPLRTVLRSIGETLTPQVLRRLEVARLFSMLSELLSVGIPLVESIRTLSPMFTKPGSGGLKHSLENAADSISTGQAFSDALPPGRWFDSATHRMLVVGETSGELPQVLASIAQREHRRAERSIDSLARVAEPAVVLGLAVVIGLVVMGAVLPLIRLQEIIQ